MRLKFIMILALAIITLNSCSVDDGNSNAIINYEALAIESVDLPQSFTFGATHDILVGFDYSNSCQNFAGFEVDSNLNERVITVVASVSNGNCTDEVVRREQNLRFLAASNGTYVFKFFTGFGLNNEPTYLEYTIPVEE